MFLFLNLKTKNIYLIFFYLKLFFFKFGKFVIILKQSIKKKKKIFTVLKSPHINKKAKESFALYAYDLNILFYVFDINLFIFILNKIKNSIPMDLDFKILFYSNLNTLKKKKLYNFFFKNYINSKYLKLLDIVGEIHLK